ncbi:MAG: hypothetical protein HC831_15025 [Chloroflexia bacterium]|nr:hypothetical protein [Chloroflexia bacterium]
MSKSSSFVAYLALAALILALIMTGIRYVIEEPASEGFIDRYWDSLTNILEVGAGEPGVKELFQSYSGQ